MSNLFKTLIFGPAYIDRVVRVDRPMIDPAIGGVVDRSALGKWERIDSSQRIEVGGLPEGNLLIDLPTDWPGPSGLIRLEGEAGAASDRTLQCLAWHDDLGGMGAGFAKAIGGRLHLVLGDDADPINHEIVAMLGAALIGHQPIRVPGRMGEWTLLLTSGEFGDKLAIGFRDPSQAEVAFAPYSDEECDLRVVASMTNERASEALAGRNARVRMFAPAIRNMTDVTPRISKFAKYIDILCCNRTEWESLDDREEVAWRLSILAVTDGPRGAVIRYTTPFGDAGRLAIPAFPRRNPPRDTNRAGEAFASTLVSTLLDFGWSPGETSEDLIRLAALRASAAAALVLDRVDFGFPLPPDIDQAIHDGVV